MKLAGKICCLFNGSMNGYAILWLLSRSRFFCLKVVGMNKVDVSLFRDSFKQAAIILKMKGIPSHVRNLKSLEPGNLHDPPFKSPSPSTPEFLTGLKKELQAQTDSKKWSSFLCKLLGSQEQVRIYSDYSWHLQSFQPLEELLYLHSVIPEDLWKLQFPLQGNEGLFPHSLYCLHHSQLYAIIRAPPVVCFSSYAHGSIRLIKLLISKCLLKEQAVARANSLLPLYC